MTFGREQAALPEFGSLKKLYISLLGFPAVGLQMRGRRILPVVKREARKLQATRNGGGGGLNICDAGCGRGALSFAIARSLPD